MNKRIFFFNEDDRYRLQDERNETSITSYYFNKKDSILIENNGKKPTIPFRFDHTFKLFSDLVPDMINNVVNIVLNNIKLDFFDFAKFPKLKCIFLFKTVIRSYELKKRYKISFTSPCDINFTSNNIIKKMKKGSLFYEEKKNFLYGIHKDIEYKIEKKMMYISSEKKKRLKARHVESFFKDLPMKKNIFETIRMIRIKNLKIYNFNFCLFLNLKHIILYNSKLDKTNIFPAKKILISKTSDKGGIRLISKNELNSEKT